MISIQQAKNLLYAIHLMIIGDSAILIEED